MKDFIFRNDTKLLFRNDIRTAVVEITKGHKVMFVYGGGSVKRNGCYDDIIQSLNEADIPFVEYGGSSREFAKIQEGIRVAKTNGITMIIGVGGASVMDSAKLMAFGFYHESDLWDYVKGKTSYGLERLPLVLIPTYPSSGSENGLGAVAVDSRTGDFGTAYGIPADYAVLCPKYSLTLNKEMTTYTGLATVVQLSACVLGDKNKMSYDAGISYIKNVLEATKILQQHPDDLDARGNHHDGSLAFHFIPFRHRERGNLRLRHLRTGIPAGKIIRQFVSQKPDIHFPKIPLCYGKASSGRGRKILPRRLWFRFIYRGFVPKIG